MKKNINFTELIFACKPARNATFLAINREKTSCRHL